MSAFTIIPAIDLKGGKCVRLLQGRADRETVYSDDPVEMARRWQGEGAEYIHVVDLDGAFEGRPVQSDLVVRIARAVTVPVDIGGGLRTDEDVRHYLDNGLSRAIVGTRACAQPGELKRLVELFGPGLAVGIDARGGRVQVKGWTETTGMDAVELAQQMDGAGVATIIYTDTARDGMLEGVNADAMDAMCDAVSCFVIASGGVSSAADVAALRKLRRPNLAGVIVGKALYDGRVTLAELKKACV